MKACFSSVIERQNVKLVLKVINELTLAALRILDDSRLQQYRKNTSDFISFFHYGKYSTSIHRKGIRLNDSLSIPLTFNDERFFFLT